MTNENCRALPSDSRSIVCSSPSVPLLLFWPARPAILNQLARKGFISDRLAPHDAQSESSASPQRKEGKMGLRPHFPSCPLAALAV
jgi:hypothetical protein